MSLIKAIELAVADINKYYNHDSLISYPAKLRILANWFDGEHLFRSWTSNEVQTDLRTLADRIEEMYE
jgi:hypothetical protein